jgi:hypothetical protein
MRDLRELAARVAVDPVLRARLGQDPAGVLAELAAAAVPPAARDRFVYRFVVVVLGALVLGVAALAGGVALVPGEPPRRVPEVLVSLGSAAIGALAGLLAPSPLAER